MADEGAGHRVAYTDGLSLRGAGRVRSRPRQRQPLALLCGRCGVARACDSWGRSSWSVYLHRAPCPRAGAGDHGTAIDRPDV